MYSGKAKVSKRVKKDKPVDESILQEPVLQTVVPEASATEPPPEPVHEPPTSATDPPAEQALDGSDNPEVSSPAKKSDPQEAVVEITKTSYMSRDGLLCLPNALPKKNSWNTVGLNLTLWIILT